MVTIKKKSAKSAAKPGASKATANKPAKKDAGKSAANPAAAEVLEAAAAIDWKRASGGRVGAIGTLLAELVNGKAAVRAKAYDALRDAIVGRPLACVVGPFLVDLAIADGARVDALRLLAAIHERMPPPTRRSAQR